MYSSRQCLAVTVGALVLLVAGAVAGAIIGRDIDARHDRKVASFSRTTGTVVETGPSSTREDPCVEPLDCGSTTSWRPSVSYESASGPQVARTVSADRLDPGARLPIWVQPNGSVSLYDPQLSGGGGASVLLAFFGVIVGAIAGTLLGVVLVETSTRVMARRPAPRVV